MDKSSEMRRRLSWEEDDRPAPKKSKRGRPPASMTRPNSAPSWVDASRVNGRPRTGESIVAAAMAAAKGSRRNSLRHMGAKSNDDQVLYCICRKPYDVPRFMIACDRCDQWFHGECIGISEKEGEFIDLYFCTDCAQATGKMTSWKPKCVNPACPKAARISSHQGRVSKYCSDTCGLQVARARVELAERRGHSDEQSYTDMLTQRQRRARLNQLVKNDMSRLSQLTKAWRRIRDQITIMNQRTRFLKLIIQHHHGDDCGLDTRLHWTDDVWQQVNDMTIDDDNEIVLKFASNHVPVFSTCRNMPCPRHHGWKDLKLQEFEQDRQELFHALARYAKQKRQIKDRIKRKRNTIDDEWISNTTIVHKEK
ncbi:hypothetical protein K492DRAFT_186499 [Lichtheimia hyalospora FSU 10163]|nr:hypothetical protein K492DRAFT_186499 [Lichtheimia hyalospora FSU 10163]